MWKCSFRHREHGLVHPGEPVAAVEERAAQVHAGQVHIGEETARECHEVDGPLLALRLVGSDDHSAMREGARQILRHDFRVEESVTAVSDYYV